jgi:Heterokaryon incompatibility protein (HET)
VMNSIRANLLLSDVTFWVDHECIDQDDEEEKQSQVAIMDQIYTKAQLTAILLEDVELSTEELDFMMRKRRKIGADLLRHTRITQRILAGRWFSRAWCSQEMVLSRASVVYLHRTNEEANPVSFAIGLLTAWIATAMIYDRSIKRLSEPRGLNGPAMRTAHGMHAVAWAYGIIHGMNCYNSYDKVSLVQNLVRSPVHNRLKVPDTKGDNIQIAKDNVDKIINMLAILYKDFSLLQTNHISPFQHNPQNMEGFSWAGAPVKDDSVSEAWHPKDYDVAMDPNFAISEDGIDFKGYAARILKQNEWEIYRDETTLHVTVDGMVKVVDSDWLTNDAFTPQSPLSLLRDILYAMEAFDAKDIYPFFLPSEGNWTERDVFLGDLKGDILSYYSRVSSPHEALAQGLRFLKTERGGISFSVVRFQNAPPLVVRMNVRSVEDKMIFQPFVMRPKVFGAYLLTANAMIFDGKDFGKNGLKHRCIGNLRGLGLIPEEKGPITIRVF